MMGDNSSNCNLTLHTEVKLRFHSQTFIEQCPEANAAGKMSSNRQPLEATPSQSMRNTIFLLKIGSKALEFEFKLYQTRVKSSYYNA